MPVLVTGATGFLGRHIVACLVERGEHVRALVRPGSDASALVALGVEVARGELFGGDEVRRAGDGCRVVLHVAGLVSHERRQAAELERVNVSAVRAVLEAVDPSARFVHVSSVAALGPAPDPGRPADESQEFPAWAERLPYAASKHAGERVVLEAAERGRDAVVANPGFLLGPGDVNRVSTWHVGRYLAGTLRIHVPGGVSSVDARDVAVGVLAVADGGRTGERYVLTSREGNLSHADFFRRVARITGVERRMLALPPSAAALGATLLPWPVKPGEARAAAFWWFYDPAKAERELGFTTRPLDETIADTAAQHL